MIGFRTSLAVFAVCFFLNLPVKAQHPVTCGLDRLQEFKHLFAGKRVGLVTNHTAVDKQGIHISDLFGALPGVTISAFFGPEHGFRGSSAAGDKVSSTADPLLNVPVYSLYGKVRKPTPEMLNDVDVLVFDIQDVGSRFYTYIWTMALAMEAAAEQNIPFVVLDRPNPINGLQVEGNVLDTAFATFVGLYPIPVRHGMTVGELAQLFNGAGWLKNGITTKLTVVPVHNWLRGTWYDATGLQFVKPSPNMLNLETATVYPGMCLLEGTNLSEGRGTPLPFLQIGAPWIDGRQLAASLDKIHIPGVRFESTTFTPKSTPGKAPHPKYENESCDGCRIVVTNREQFRPYRTGIILLQQILRLYPGRVQWRQKHFDRLSGSAAIRAMLQSNADLSPLFEEFERQEARFKEIRQQYLLYP